MVANKHDYDAFYQTGDWRNHNWLCRLELRAYLKILDLVYGVQVQELVDAGCGTGAYTKAADDIGLQALGFDYSASAITQARKKYPQCHFECADAYDLQLRQIPDLIFAKGFSPFNTRNGESIRNLLAHWLEQLSTKGAVVFVGASDFTGEAPTGWIRHRETELPDLFGSPHYDHTIVALHSKLRPLILLPLAGQRVLRCLDYVSRELARKLGLIVRIIVILRKR